MDIASLSNLIETRRLAALQALDLLDTAPERDFDAVARLARIATGCKMAWVALVDDERMWVKACAGPVPAALPRAITFCDTTVRQDAPLIVDDLSLDPRFRDTPLVAQGLRFYAGLPIRVVDSHGVRQPIGTICVADVVPCHLSESASETLGDLAMLTESLIAARTATREAVAHAVVLERQHRIFRQAERMARIGWWRLNLDDERVEWSDGIFRIHDVEPDQHPNLSTAIDFYPPDARAVVSRSLAHTIETGQPFDLEVDFVSAKGVERRLRSMGEIEWAGNRPAAVIGVTRDISEEYALSQALRRSADSDPLTHIANRTVFNRRLEAAIASSISHDTPLALVLIDLDNFKQVNDTFGHPAGDEVLKTIAGRLHVPWLKDCCSARLGGDEFAIIVDARDLLANEAALVARIENELRVTTTIDGLTMETGASVGLTRFDRTRHASLRSFVHAADTALYAAKRRRVGDRRAA